MKKKLVTVVALLLALTTSATVAFADDEASASSSENQTEVTSSSSNETAVRGSSSNTTQAVSSSENKTTYVGSTSNITKAADATVAIKNAKGEEVSAYVYSADKDNAIVAAAIDRGLPVLTVNTTSHSASDVTKLNLDNITASYNIGYYNLKEEDLADGYTLNLKNENVFVNGTSYRYHHYNDSYVEQEQGIAVAKDNTITVTLHGASPLIIEQVKVTTSTTTEKTSTSTGTRKKANNTAAQ